MPALVQTRPGGKPKASITITLLDSENLLVRAAIDSEFHARLGIPIEDTKIQARAANKQSLEIQGVSQGIYLKFPNIAKVFFVKPLVVRNLSCNLNLGAQFNYRTEFVPQEVVARQERSTAASMMAQG